MSEISKLYQFIAYIGINTADTKHGNNDSVVTHQEFYNLATSDDYTDWAKKNYYDDKNCDHDDIKKPTRSTIDNVWKTFDIRNDGGDSDIVSGNRTLVKNCGALDDKEFEEIEKVIQIHAAFNNYLEQELFAKISEHAPGLEGDYHNAWKGEVRDGLSEILEQLINQNTPADQIVSRIKASGEVDTIIKNATINAYKTQVLAETRKKDLYGFRELEKNSGYCIYSYGNLHTKIAEYINTLDDNAKPADILTGIQGIVDAYIKSADKTSPEIPEADKEKNLNELQSARLQLHIFDKLKASVAESATHAELYSKNKEIYEEAFKNYAETVAANTLQKDYKAALTDAKYAYNGTFDAFIETDGKNVINEINDKITTTKTEDVDETVDVDETDDEVDDNDEEGEEGEEGEVDDPPVTRTYSHPNYTPKGDTSDDLSGEMSVRFNGLSLKELLAQSSSVGIALTPTDSSNCYTSLEKAKQEAIKKIEKLIKELREQLEDEGYDEVIINAACELTLKYYMAVINALEDKTTGDSTQGNTSYLTAINIEYTDPQTGRTISYSTDDVQWQYQATKKLKDIKIVDGSSMKGNTDGLNNLDYSGIRLEEATQEDAYIIGVNSKTFIARFHDFMQLAENSLSVAVATTTSATDTETGIKDPEQLANSDVKLDNGTTLKELLAKDALPTKNIVLSSFIKGVEEAKSQAKSSITRIIKNLGTDLIEAGYNEGMINSAVTSTTSFYTSLISQMKDQRKDKGSGNHEITATTTITRADGSVIVLTTEDKFRQKTYQKEGSANNEKDSTVLATTSGSGLALGEAYNDGGTGSDNKYQIVVNPQALLKNFQNFMSMYWVQ